MVADAISTSDHRSSPISFLRWAVSIRSFTIRPKSLSVAAFQMAANSGSERTLSRGRLSSGLFVPSTGFVSHSPSPIAQAYIAERTDLARLAVGPPFFAISRRWLDTVARLTVPKGRPWSGFQSLLRYRVLSISVRGFMADCFASR